MKEKISKIEDVVDTYLGTRGHKSNEELHGYLKRIAEILGKPVISGKAWK